MKIYMPVALVLAACVVLPAAAQDCTFDQRAVASELQRMARRNPGYRSIPAGLGVEWVEPDYKVRLSYGGCDDLGKELVLTRTSAGRPIGTRQLVAAVSRYVSVAQGRAANQGSECTFSRQESG